MIHLTYANRTEALLDALVRRLDARRARGDDPLEPVRIVVPNRNVERYVELGVARGLGIAANLRFERLAGFVRTWLETDGATAGPLLLDDALTARVLRALIDDELLARAPMHPVRRYLRAAGDDGEAIDLRRAQLALHVARLFEEYGFSRPELLDAWSAGQLRFASTTHAATEAWQAEAWRWMREHPACAGARTLNEALADAAPPPFAELHVFGLSYVARVFSRLFGVLGERCDLYLYALNPCEEFWEDVETEGELRRRRRSSDAEPEWLFEDEDPFRLSVDTETPLLRLWGRPGREHVRLLDALTECDFTPAFVDPLAAPDGGDEEAPPAALPLFSRLDAPPLLERLQHDILTRAPRDDRPAEEVRDESVQVIAAPSIRREVETVAAEIWNLVETLDDLTFDRVAVLVNGPDRDLYLPHLVAVFEEAHQIPFNVADLSLASVSPIVEAATRLVELPLSRMTRPDVLGVITHPAVRARFADVDAHDWVALCERLGIFHGLDHEAHAGTYVGDDDLLSWEQGLVRVALGGTMTGERSGDERFVAVDGHRYLPEEPPVGDLRDARFALLVRSLLGDVRFARAATLSLTAWSRFFVALLRAYLTPVDDREAAALRRALAAVEAIATLDLDGAVVGYGIAHELVRTALDALTGGRGQHLADGVAVSSLMPMRAIPFRVIFVLGLGEGRFPAADRRDTMDLRAARRQAGDVTPPERDRYTFLETLLCARERLYLSYVARDETTGDPLAPSTVVAELLDVIDRGYLEDARGRIVRRPALRRDEEARMAEVLPAAAAERRARRLGDALRSELARDGREELLAAIGAEEASRRVARADPLRATLGLAALPERAPAEVEAATLRVSLSTLRKFLECPLQAWTQRVLRLEEDQLDTRATVADEPFAPSALDETVVLRASFVDAVLSDASAEHSYEERVAVLESRGRWPIGAIAALKEVDHREILARWRDGWERLGACEGRGRVRFGAAQSGESTEEVLDPIVIAFDDDPRSPGSGRALRVEITGRTELLRFGPRASVLPLVGRKTGQRGRVDELRYAMRAFFDHVALGAAGRPAPHRSIQLFGDRDGSAPAVVDFDAVSHEAASAWLRSLVRDLLGRPHAYLMPIEAVLSLADRFDEVRGEELVASIEMVKGRWGGGQSRYGPVREPLRFPPPAVGEAEEILERRFGLPMRSMRR